MILFCIILIAGCANSFIKEIHHFRVLGNELVSKHILCFGSKFCKHYSVLLAISFTKVHCFSELLWLKYLLFYYGSI